MNGHTHTNPMGYDPGCPVCNGKAAADRKAANAAYLAARDAARKP